MSKTMQSCLSARHSGRSRCLLISPVTSIPQCKHSRLAGPVLEDAFPAHCKAQVKENNTRDSLPRPIHAVICHHTLTTRVEDSQWCLLTPFHRAYYSRPSRQSTPPA